MKLPYHLFKHLFHGLCEKIRFREHLRDCLSLSSGNRDGRQIKLFVVVPYLVGGGAERVVTLLLQYINREKFEPSLVLYNKLGVYMDELPPNLHIIDLGFQRKTFLELPSIIWNLAQVIKREKPDVVLSFLTFCNLTTIVAAKLSGVKTAVVVSERTHLTMELKVEPLGYVLLQQLGVRMLYPLADSIVVLSENVKKDLVENFGAPADNIEVAYNPIDIKRISRLALEPVDHPWFGGKLPVVITMGRLEPPKGYPHLLRAFAKVKKIHPCRLVILGEGSMQEELKYLARKLGIERDVAFLGFQKKPFKYLARANVFVFPTLFGGGIGNARIEAMVCGTPVISTYYPGSPNNVAEDGFSGLLVPPADDKALADAILSVLENKELAKRLAERGKRRAEDFSVDKKVREYEEILERVVR